MNAREIRTIALAGLSADADPRVALRAIVALAARDAGAKPTGSEIVAALRSYQITHWGKRGEVPRVRGLVCADPNLGVFSELGQLVSVTYETTKTGDPPRTHYEHEFSRPLPVLAYSSGGLVIAGGTYRVTWRGIVG